MVRNEGCGFWILMFAVIVIMCGIFLSEEVNQVLTWIFS